MRTSHLERERNVLLGVAAGREALDDANLTGFDPRRVGIIFGSAIGGVPGILEQHDILRERGSGSADRTTRSCPHARPAPMRSAKRPR